MFGPVETVADLSRSPFHRRHRSENGPMACFIGLSERGATTPTKPAMCALQSRAAARSCQRDGDHHWDGPVRLPIAPVAEGDRFFVTCLSSLLVELGR